MQIIIIKYIIIFAKLQNYFYGLFILKQIINYYNILINYEYSFLNNNLIKSDINLYKAS